MMRQIGKQVLTIAVLAILAMPAGAASLVTAIVTDPISGVAIDGYDPVSYFIAAEPQPGKPDYEYEWGGVPWYFESAANRDVFIRNPSIYAPQYGGHCLTALSRGFLSDGKPRLFVIDGLKLYFFYSTANRDAFLLSRQGAFRDAAANWPALSADLSGMAGDTPASAPIAAADAAPASVAPATTDANLGATDSAETPHG